MLTAARNHAGKQRALGLGSTIDDDEELDKRDAAVEIVAELQLTAEQLRVRISSNHNVMQTCHVNTEIHTQASQLEDSLEII